MLYIERWQKTTTIIVCVLALLFCIPSMVGPKTQQWLADNMPPFLPHQTVNLGLDLRGGSHLLLQVDMDVAIRDKFATLVDEARRELRAKDIGYNDLGTANNTVSLTVRDAAQLEEARKIVRALMPGLQVNAEGQKLSAIIDEAALRDIKKKVLDQSIEIVRRRIDETGTREPSIQQQGEDRILVQLPGVDNPQRMKDLIGQTAKLTFRFVDANMPSATPGTTLPAGTELLQDQKEPNRYWVVQRRVIVGGDTLDDAQASFGQDGSPVVSFRFDGMGGRRFGQATTENVGKLFAIVLDNKVLSAPVIREPITGGNGQISGNFTTQEAQDLSLLLRAGALPAPLTVLEERTVGPGLGADSIRAGATACLVGLVLVVIFMIIVYGRFGVYGTIALAINLALIMAILSIMQATLTLPGIAGIVLTIGMAVDANVLVFERMREESRLGRTVLAAVDAGYSRAWTAIVDANVTTLIAAFLLFLFGTGPVKGFAVTLSIGILTSLFSALMLTKLLIASYLQRARPKALPI
jgi:preprotein translocase subunit SecD